MISILRVAIGNVQVLAVTIAGAIEPTAVPTQEVPRGLGTVVQCVQDVDGDGAAEFVVSSPSDVLVTQRDGGRQSAPLDRGTIWLCSLAKGAALAKLSGESGGCRLGASMAIIEHPVGSATQCLVVGEPGFDVGRGRISVLEIVRIRRIASLEGEPDGRGFGSVLVAPEVGSSGRAAPLVVGSAKFTLPNDVYAGVTLSLCDAVNAKRLAVRVLPEGDQLSANGLIRIADQNGDGVADVACGVSRVTTGLSMRRSLHVLVLCGLSLEVIRELLVPGEVSSGEISLIQIGTGSNRDGRRVLVGSPGGEYDGNALGRALSFNADRDGFEDLLPLRLQSGERSVTLTAEFRERIGSRLGASLASPGDVDHDGLADYVVGSPLGAIADEDYGWIQVVSGRDNSVISRCNWGGLAPEVGFGYSLWCFEAAWGGRVRTMLAASALHHDSLTSAVVVFDMSKAAASADLLPSAIGTIRSVWPEERLSFWRPDK